MKPTLFICSYLLLPLIYDLNCSSWVSLTHLVCLASSKCYGAHTLCIHDILHIILDHLFFLLYCSFYCCFWFCCSCWCCWFLNSSSLGKHGLVVRYCYNCSISLGIWPILSLVLSTQYQHLHICCWFLHHCLHLS